MLALHCCEDATLEFGMRAKRDTWLVGGKGERYEHVFNPIMDFGPTYCFRSMTELEPWISRLHV